MYGWEIVEGRDHRVPMWRPEFETSPNMKTFGLMVGPTRAMCITGKEVIIDSGFCFLKGILEMRKRGGCGSALIKRDNIGLKGFVEMASTITSGQKKC